MNLLQLFQRTLNASYIQLAENTASYHTERRGETLYLFFEKSNGATDWKNNFDFPARPYRHMEDVWFVHRGFLRVFKTIEPFLAPLVLDPRVKRIVSSGYSHGAALALLAHEYCMYHRPEIAADIYGYGFGCPRVVWGPLNRRLKRRFEHFTVIKNCRDIVTHLPPRLFWFRHVGNLLHIGVGKGYGFVDSHRAESYLKELAGRERA